MKDGCEAETASPSRFFSAPAKAPRTVCGCQPVASTTCAMVAPSDRFSTSEKVERRGRVYRIVG